MIKMDDSPSYDNTDNDKDSDSELDSLYDALKKHDDIRFATYRTAAKLRYIQRRTFLHHIDIWNMIEAFRENGLNTLEPGTMVNRARMETVLNSLYSNLNKRLPPGQHLDIEKTSNVLSTWLLFTYCQDESSKVRVFSIKIGLAVLASGKLMDKLRFMFSQITDSNGHLIPESPRFVQYLKDMMKLPAAVGERQTFNIKEDAKNPIFAEGSKVTVNEFLETMMSDPGPQSVSWLLVLHRITAAEAVFHPVPCSACRSEGFHGLRYKSDSANYHLCQMCFWRGNMDTGHRDDVFKEYSVWKSPGKQAGLRRSLRCVPPGAQKRIPQFPEQSEPPLDLANIVPASPLPSHNGLERLMMARPSHHPQFATVPGPGAGRQLNSSQEQEHHLIASYARRLAGHSPEDDLDINVRTMKSQRREQSGDRKEDKNLRLVQELELKNAEIMKEIARLRQNRATEIERASQNPVSSELENLRTRKMELELRLSELQQTRKDLMIELEQLMKVLKVQGPSNNQASKFNKISRNQTASTQLRPFLGLGTGPSQPEGLLYVRSPDDINNSETGSMPASVNSLSE